MNKDFLASSLKALLPIWILLSYLYISGHVSSDFFFHISNRGVEGYPPFLSFLLHYAEGFRPSALFVLNLLFTTLIPFALIYKITKKLDACYVYLYSGIPLILFVVWLVPQSMIHCLILLTILDPIIGFALFVGLGYFIHHYWWVGLLLGFGWHIWKWKLNLLSYLPWVFGDW